MITIDRTRAYGLDSGGHGTALVHTSYFASSIIGHNTWIHRYHGMDDNIGFLISESESLHEMICSRFKTVIAFYTTIKNNAAMTNTDRYDLISGWYVKSNAI